MTNTKLKMIAIASMLMDHLYAFGLPVPYWFHLIGRIAAPLFLFCCIEGFVHTHSCKAYIVRLYILNVIMGVVNLVLPLNEDYNFVRSLLLLVLILIVWQEFARKEKHAKKYVATFLIWQIVVYAIILVLSQRSIMEFDMTMFVLTITGSLGELDGGLLYILTGIVIYACRRSKKALLVSYSAICVIYLMIFNTSLMAAVLSRMPIDETITAWLVELFFGVNPMLQSDTGLIFGNPQWMMVFALPFMLLYNKEKGVGLKWLFYAFYPVHIVILYFLSCAIV